MTSENRFKDRNVHLKMLSLTEKCCLSLVLLGGLLAVQLPQNAKAEMAIGARTFTISDEAATREKVGKNWSGTRLSALFRVKTSWLIEAGFAGFADVPDKAPISVSPGAGNRWLIAPHSEIRATSYYAQLGYRFYVIEKEVSWSRLSLWIDASAGYEGVSAKRQITNSSAYDYLSQTVDIEGGAYVQPRINLICEPAKKGWYVGFQVAYDHYFSSDINNGLCGGLVFGYSAKEQKSE